jgi:hypothetical protein
VSARPRWWDGCTRVVVGKRIGQRVGRSAVNIERLACDHEQMAQHGSVVLGETERVCMECVRTRGGGHV